MRFAPAGTDPQALAARARDAGRPATVVTASRTKAATLRAFASALDLPEWFGHNLDALADALDGVAAAGPADLIVAGLERLRQADETSYRGVIGVLRTVARAHPDLHVTVIGG